MHRLTLLALGMLAVPLVNGLLGVAQRYLGASVGEGVICDLRTELYDHLHRMSLRFFTHTKTGELMSRLNNDVIGAQRAVSGTIVDVFTNSVTLVSALAIMLRLEWRLTLLAIAVLPLFLVPARLLGKKLRTIVRQQMTLNAEMNAMMDETLNVSGALLVKLFGRGPDEVSRFRGRAERVRQAGVRQAYMMRWFFLTVSLISAVGTVVVFWGGGLLVLRGAGFTIGTMVAFTAYLGMLYGPLSALTNARMDLATSLVSFERVFEVLDLPLEIAERPDAKALTTVRGDVRFDRVSFSYEPDDGAEEAAAAGLAEVVRFGGPRSPAMTAPPLSQEGGKLKRTRGARTNAVPQAPVERGWALRDISFEIRPGQLAALVGPSGSGKTTVTYLLPRLYDPTEGAVSIDGHDLRDLSLATLAEQIGMVTQETFLFNDTIRANLLYAKPERRAGRDRGGLPGGQHPRLHRRPAGRLRHRRRQPRLPALGRREAARGHRPGHPQGPAHPRPRRGHLVPRQPIRSAHPGRPRAHHEEPDEPRHRPPPEHDPGGGRHPGPGGRPPRRAAGRTPSSWPRAGSTPPSTRPSSGSTGIKSGTQYHFPISFGG